MREPMRPLKCSPCVIVLGIMHTCVAAHLGLDTSEHTPIEPCIVGLKHALVSLPHQEVIDIHPLLSGPHHNAHIIHANATTVPSHMVMKDSGHRKKRRRMCVNAGVHGCTRICLLYKHV